MLDRDYVCFCPDYRREQNVSSRPDRGRKVELGGTSVCYRDAWESVHSGEFGHTFTPANPLVPSLSNPLVDGEMPLEPGRRIDYVFVRCGDHEPTLEVSACWRIFDGPVCGVWASDHFGVVADLAVPTPTRTSTPS